MEPKFEGVNALVYEDNHDYLRDLRTQTKRRCYPANTESSKEFGDLVFPASHYTRQNLTKDVPRNGKDTPASGNWAMRRSEPSGLEAAGARRPRDLDLR